jgi:DNA-binding GntR family transcriptional regulator
MTDPADSLTADRRRGSGVRIVADVLREEILDLSLAPGSIVDEVQLADRFGLSRTPIREALVRLAGEGLIVTLPNRSTMVAPIDFANITAYFDALVLMYRVTTRLAAEFRSDADLTRLGALQERFASAVAAGNDLAMIAANRDLHAAIAEAGRNPYYLSLFLRLLDEGRRILRMYYYTSFKPASPHPYILEHEAILAAIAARDIDGADRLARDHAEQIVRQIKSMIAPDARPDIPL